MAMTLVSTVTVGSGGAASIEFTGIPQTGKDLLVLLSARNTGGDQFSLLSLNSSTTNFAYRFLFGTGSAVSSFGESGTDAARRVALMPASTWTSSTFSNDSIYISNYSGAQNKSISTDSVREQNDATGGLRITATQWSNTAAITSLTLTPNGNSYAQHSTASLYIVS